MVTDSQHKERLGEEITNNFGTKMIITAYRCSHDIDISLPEHNGFVITHKTYGDFKRGKIKSPYCKSVCGIGYGGVGEYPSKTSKFTPKSYTVWHDMINRCYNKKAQIKVNKWSYKDCTVCNEWLDYQIFCKWFYENYYEIVNERVVLDKDILIKDNKIYSPDTCIFVPEKINLLLVKCKRSRGSSPIGVSKCKKNKQIRGNV